MVPASMPSLMSSMASPVRQHFRHDTDMIEKLDITHLRTLNALFRCGNITATAEYLDVSQQAISLQLKKLRTILNDPLFIRTGHGVTPTPYAVRIEPHIRQILAQLHAIPLPDTMTAAQTTRTLVISATDYTQTVIVGELIAALRQTAPGVRIIVNNIDSAHLLHKMQSGDIDLALTSNSYVPEGLHVEPLFVEQYRCVTANQSIPFDHDLPIAQLVEHDFVVVSPGIASFKGSADPWFEQQGLKRNVVISAPSFFMAMTYLKQSDMVGFIPARLLPCEGLRDIPLQKYPPGYEVVAAYHPGARHDPLVTWVLELLRKRFAGSR